MKNIIKTIFVIILLTILALPVIFFNPKQEVSEKEKRSLAKRPALFNEDGLNYKIFTEYDNYFQDHLGFRDQLIQLNVKNPLKVQISDTKKVIEGKDGWYFLTDPNEGRNLHDFYKRNLLTPDELKGYTEKVSKVVEWCKQENIKFFFMICPNKHSVYEEFYPKKRPEGITRSDQLTGFFEELNVPYVFPRDLLISQKDEHDFPLYIETDTHWNSYAAYLTSLLVRDKLAELFPEITFPKIDYSVSISESDTKGDLLPMLNITNAKSTQIKMTPKDHENTDFFTYLLEGDEDTANEVHTVGTNNKLPRALIFRDSFMVALEPFISPFFSEADYQWKHFSDSDKELVLNYKPDIIIFEVVERFSPDIIE